VKTLLILVDDTYADTLKAILPDDKAWVLNPKYDSFRCQLHHEFETYKARPERFEAYHDALNDIDAWLSKGDA